MPKGKKAEYDGPLCEECGKPTIKCVNLTYCDDCHAAAEAEAEAEVAGLDIRVCEIPKGWDIDDLYNAATTRWGEPIDYGDDTAVLNWFRHNYTNYDQLLHDLDEFTAPYLKIEVNRWIIAECEDAGILLDGGLEYF